MAEEVSNEVKSELEADAISDFQVSPLFFFYCTTFQFFSDGVWATKVLSEMIKCSPSLVRLVRLSTAWDVTTQKGNGHNTEPAAFAEPVVSKKYFACAV